MARPINAEAKTINPDIVNDDRHDRRLDHGLNSADLIQGALEQPHLEPLAFVIVGHVEANAAGMNLLPLHALREKSFALSVTSTYFPRDRAAAHRAIALAVLVQPVHMHGFAELPLSQCGRDQGSRIHP
jgi:hypothetical protein